MSATTEDELSKKHCVPCEGGVAAITREEAESMVRNLDGWALSKNGKEITRSWTVTNFLAGIDFFNKIAAVAEQEDHHPDLHLEGYRKVKVALSTHAVGGLTENDFVLAAKINRIPVSLKSLK